MQLKIKCNFKSALQSERKTQQKKYHTVYRYTKYNNVLLVNEIIVFYVNYTATMQKNTDLEKPIIRISWELFKLHHWTESVPSISSVKDDTVAACHRLAVVITVVCSGLLSVWPASSASVSQTLFLYIWYIWNQSLAPWFKNWSSHQPIIDQLNCGLYSKYLLMFQSTLFTQQIKCHYSWISAINSYSVITTGC